MLSHRILRVVDVKSVPVVWSILRGFEQLKELAMGTGAARVTEQVPESAALQNHNVKQQHEEDRVSDSEQLSQTETAKQTKHSVSDVASNERQVTCRSHPAVETPACRSRSRAGGHGLTSLP